MLTHPVAESQKPQRALLRSLRRAQREGLGETTLIMARRELARALPAGTSGLGPGAGMVAAVGLALLIPLHRAYGGDGPGELPPYFLLFSLLIQIGMIAVSARAVWASARRDIASGSLEELLLTGVQPEQMLAGKWAGTSLAAALWTFALLPAALIAAACSGASLAVLPPLLLSWVVSAAAGAALGAVLALSERSATATGGIWWGVIQGWLLFRFLMPRLGSGLGPGWSSLMRLIQDLDPLTLVPAAIGRVHEPWWAKLLALVSVVAVSITWLLCTEHDLPLPSRQRPTEADAPMLSLRPIRAWMTGRQRRTTVAYHRSVLFPFEQAHGWRLRVSPPVWLLLLAPGLMLSLPLAILGREAHAAAKLLLPLEVALGALISGLGAAASLAAEREQGRWALLLCAPFTTGEIVRAKWRAAWLESWPLWPASAVHTLLLCAAGALPWSVFPVAVLAVPIAAGAAAGAVATACATAPSLTSAQQRALLLLGVPPLIIAAGSWLLPGLHGPGFFSLPQLVLAAQGFRPGWAAPVPTLAALGAYTAMVPASLWLADWQLRRWPPL